MFKVFWEDLGGQFVDVFDDKTMAIFAPGYDVFILGILGKGMSTSTIL